MKKIPNFWLLPWTALLRVQFYLADNRKSKFRFQHFVSDCFHFQKKTNGLGVDRFGKKGPFGV